MHSGVTFNGTHCTAVNLQMINTPRIPILPETKDTYVDIPHKDGAVLIPDNSARDILIEVDFLLIPPQGMNVWLAATQLTTWLWTAKREQLIFDFLPSHYYNGKVINNIDMQRVVKYGTFTVVFRCEPFPKAVGS